jgi:plastocyanin
MNRRIPVALAAAVALAAPALAVAAPHKNRIVISGGDVYKPGFYVKNTMHFGPRTLTVKSGATVTVLNQASAQEPHTVSFVKASQVPRTKKAIVACSNFKGVCGALAQAHQADPQTGQVKVPVVDVGKPGVDRPGDSFFIAPGAKKLTFKVTAKKGTTLRYFCVIHPWMQGTIKVR